MSLQSCSKNDNFAQEEGRVRIQVDLSGLKASEQESVQKPGKTNSSLLVPPKVSSM